MGHGARNAALVGLAVLGILLVIREVRHRQQEVGWAMAVNAANQASREARHEADRERIAREGEATLRRENETRWRGQREELLRRLRQPRDVAIAVPDTCREVVGELVEQIDIRDSLRTVDSLKADADWESWNRTAASYAKDLAAARVQWAEWEHLAKSAPRPTSLALGIAAKAGINAPDEVAMDVRWRATGPLWLVAEGTAQWDSLSAKPRYGGRVGAKIEVRLR
jgi:hypothetical protein